MRLAPCFLFVLTPLCCYAQEPAPMPGSHQELAIAILQYLSDTEVCLNSCIDEASVQAALPRLRQLADQARSLAEHQRELDEPSQQDHIAMQQHIKRFNTLWSAIRQHLDRLEKSNLMSPELRVLLRVAPSRQDSRP